MARTTLWEKMSSRAGRMSEIEREIEGISDGLTAEEIENLPPRTIERWNQLSHEHSRHERSMRNGCKRLKIKWYSSRHLIFQQILNASEAGNGRDRKEAK